MGTLLDTSILIELERAAPPLDPRKDIAIAAITASELLQGVLRADAAHRAPRESFVEALLATVPTIPFSLRVARVHAGLWAQLATRRKTIAPHDLIVASTAVSLGWELATLNRKHFQGIPGLVLATESQPS